jgi:hypothetical protein
VGSYKNVQKNRCSDKPVYKSIEKLSLFLKLWGILSLFLKLEVLNAVLKSTEMLSLLKEDLHEF